MKTQKEIFIIEYNSSNEYVSRKKFEVLCKRFGIGFNTGVKILASQDKETTLAKENNSTFNAVLAQNSELLDYYYG